VTKLKKEVRIQIPVSRTNFNRVKYGTHTLIDVLTREGYKASVGGMMNGDEIVGLHLVDLTIKPKPSAVKWVAPQKTEDAHD